MQTLFDAVDISGILNNVMLLMIGFIGIGLYFLAASYIRRLIKKTQHIEL